MPEVGEGPDDVLLDAESSFLHHTLILLERTEHSTRYRINGVCTWESDEQVDPD